MTTNNEPKVKVQCHLYVSSDGKLRMTRGKQDTNANEIRFRLDLYVPKRLFERPDPVIIVDVPDVLYDSNRDVDAELFAENISDQIEAAIADFEDGLANKVAQHISGAFDRAKNQGSTR